MTPQGPFSNINNRRIHIFLETNYNINFIVNNEYRKIQIDTNKSKEVLKKRKKYNCLMLAESERRNT